MLAFHHVQRQMTTPFFQLQKSPLGVHHKSRKDAFEGNMQVCALLADSRRLFTISTCYDMDEWKAQQPMAETDWKHDDKKTSRKTLKMRLHNSTDAIRMCALPLAGLQGIKQRVWTKGLGNFGTFCGSSVHGYGRLRLRGITVYSSKTVKQERLQPQASGFQASGFRPQASGMGSSGMFLFCGSVKVRANSLAVQASHQGSTLKLLRVKKSCRPCMSKYRHCEKYAYLFIHGVCVRMYEGMIKTKTKHLWAMSIYELMLLIIIIPENTPKKMHKRSSKTKLTPGPHSCFWQELVCYQVHFITVTTYPTYVCCFTDSL